MPRRRVLAAAVGIVALLGACGSGDDESSAPSVDDAWARTSADGQTTGAAYLTITGGADDDRLVAATAPSEVAGTTEVHETVEGAGGADHEGMADDGSDDHAGEGMGTMTMREVPSIEVPAGGEVRMEPGGFHVMLLDLPTPLVEGDAFELELTFEAAGTQTVTVEVRDR